MNLFLCIIPNILFSESLQQYYCVSTQNIENRLVEHNAGETKSIKHGSPWKLIGYLQFTTRSEAIKKEKQIKARGIKRWLEYGMKQQAIII